MQSEFPIAFPTLTHRPPPRALRMAADITFCSLAAAVAELAQGQALRLEVCAVAVEDAAGARPKLLAEIKRGKDLRASERTSTRPLPPPSARQSLLAEIVRGKHEMVDALHARVPLFAAYRFRQSLQAAWPVRHPGGRRCPRRRSETRIT